MEVNIKVFPIKPKVKVGDIIQFPSGETGMIMKLDTAEYTVRSFDGIRDITARFLSLSVLQEELDEYNYFHFPASHFEIQIVNKED